MKKCEKDSKFDEKSCCCQLLRRFWEEWRGKKGRKADGKQTEVGLDKGRGGQTDGPLDKTKISVYGRRKRMEQTEDKQKRSNLDLVFHYNTKQAQYYRTNRKTPYNFHCNNQNQHKIQIYYYKTNPKLC